MWTKLPGRVWRARLGRVLGYWPAIERRGSAGRVRVLGRAYGWDRLARLLVLPVLCLVSDAGADIYRYVDQDGVIHFSNKTRRGQRVVRENTPTNKPSQAPSGRSAPLRWATSYDAIIREAASLYQIPEALIRAVIAVESGFNQRAVSRANAQGLMQLIPATAQHMMVRDVFDPRENVLGGTRYLRLLANLFNGNLELTLAGYNAGENAVIRYGGIPPYEETQGYVVKVIEYYRQYRSLEYAQR